MTLLETCGLMGPAGVKLGEDHIKPYREEYVRVTSLSSEVPERSADGTSLLMTHVGGESNGGHLYRRLSPGYDRLHFRFYVKFDGDCKSIHHFIHVGGYIGFIQSNTLASDSE